MKKISLNFLNRLEMAIFKKTPSSHAPVSSTIAFSTLIAATLSIAIIFILQMFNVDKSAAVIVLSCLFGLAFSFSAYTCYKTMAILTGGGQKVGFSIYAFLLFGVCSLLFIWLMTWVLIITIALFIFWIIIKGTSSNSGSKKKIRVHYKDGSSEEMEEDGKGILGETYYKGDSGRTHVE